MRAFLVLDGDYLPINEIELQVRGWMITLGYTGTAEWYYDEFAEDGTEYGIKLDVRAATLEASLEQMHTLWQLCVRMYEHLEVRLEIPRQ